MSKRETIKSPETQTSKQSITICSIFCYSVWTFKYSNMGLPWRSSGWDSAFPPQRAWVRSLVRELRSHVPRSVAEKKNQIYAYF